MGTLLCAEARDPLQPGAMKGYELYSWRDTKGIWNFCILFGTNREKASEEIFRDATRLQGLDQLKQKVASLPAGAEIFWPNRIPSGNRPRAKSSESLAYPPSYIRQEVIAFAKKHGIDVQVDKAL
jgi:hypothetical protein